VGKNVLSGPFLGFLAVLGLFVVLIGSHPQGGLENFLSLRNLQVLVQEATIPAIVALGALLVILSGGIDLSVGSVVALVTVVAMQVYRRLYDPSSESSLPSWAAIICGVGVGGLCGLGNGLIITTLRVPPFVATLGMLSIARGLAVWLADRRTLAFPGPNPAWVNAFDEVHPQHGLFNPGFWSLVILAIVVFLLLRFTVWGRYFYAIGSNEATARLCGIPIRRTKILIYTLAGLLTGWAGILQFARSGTGRHDVAAGLELDVIAAVVIGGGSLTGGEGTVTGTLVGALMITVLSNGCGYLRLQSEFRFIIIGLIIVVVSAINMWRQRRLR